MTEVQKAYVAGLIDGEGSILINQRKSGSYDLRVQIGMVDSSAIEWAYTLTGLGHMHPMRSHNPMARDAKRWTCAAQDGLKLINLIFPYLLVKRRQAELYIQLMDVRANRIGKTHEQSKALQFPIAEQVKLLNRRGA